MTARSNYPYQEQVKALSLKLRYANDKALQEFGLTTPQAALLDVIYHTLQEGSPLSRRSLQEAMGLSGPSITSLIQGLTQKGLLLRTQGAHDARTFQLELTEQGHRLISHMGRIFTDTQRRMLAGMTPAEQAQLLELLIRASRNLA